MTEKPIFTIITCTYNAAAFIGRTLESVAQQTYPNIEHLIIDGASKDDTITLAKEYKDKGEAVERQHRIIITSEPDKGLYDAMNKGIDRATGHYIIFLNAGDIFRSASTLQDVAEQIEALDALPGVVYGNTDIVNEKGEFLRKRRLQPPEHLSWKSFKHGMLVCHQSFYARTDVAQLTHYDMKYRLSADVDWCIRVMKECAKQSLTLHNTHTTLCSYLEGGMSVKNHRASLKERFSIMRKHYGLISTVAMHIWFVIRSFIQK